MLKASLIEFYQRDLLKVIEELNAYPNEADIWTVKGGINNSAGNLCLHIIGNLNHFIGATLGKSAYIRDRDLEFSAKNVPRKDMIAELEKTMTVVSWVLRGMTDAKFEADFPLEKHGKIVSTVNMLLHLLAHLNYHLGQINYHRRLITTV